MRQKINIREYQEFINELKKYEHGATITMIKKNLHHSTKTMYVILRDMESTINVNMINEKTKLYITIKDFNYPLYINYVNKPFLFTRDYPQFTKEVDDMFGDNHKVYEAQLNKTENIKQFNKWLSDLMKKYKLI